MSSTERTFIVSTHENEVVWYENCMILYLYIDISYISIDIVFISDWHICFCLRYEYHDYNEMMTWCFHCRLTSTGWLDRIVQSATGPTTRLDGPMTLLRSAARDKGPRRVGEVEEYSHHFKDMFQLAMVYHHTTIIRTRQVVQVYLKSCVKTLRLGSQTWTIFQWSHWTPPRLCCRTGVKMVCQGGGLEFDFDFDGYRFFLSWNFHGWKHSENI